MGGDSFWHFAPLCLCVHLQPVVQRVNNADETVDEKNNDERRKKKNTTTHCHRKNGIMERWETDNDGADGQRRRIVKILAQITMEMAGGNITVTPCGNGNNTTAAPGDYRCQRNRK